MPKKRKIAKVRRKRAYKPRKVKFETFNDGYRFGDKLVKAWNSQPNPPPVYVAGNRIHHGLIGVLLGIGGLILETPALTGLGTRLVIDDIADMPNWLNFENKTLSQPQFHPAYVQPLQFHPITALPIRSRTEFV
ncbi:MAG: hypothetical protein KGI19_07780 [Thaumarchaeota archaeon]|nr:hypothetical protein [Nitrososphaerota archaeon]